MEVEQHFTGMLLLCNDCVGILYSANLCDTIQYSYTIVT